MRQPPASPRSRPSRVARGLAVFGVLGLIVATLTSFAAGAGAAGSEWNVARVKGPMAANGVLIAVVDTGVDASHPAFGGRVVGRLDYTKDDEPGSDKWHGTHVAGTAAGGVLDCGDGPMAVGAAPDARILDVRVLSPDGSGYMSDVSAGVRAAADRGAAVINLSLGEEIVVRNLDGGSRQFLEALEYAWAKGSIPVLAAGNEVLIGSFLDSGYRDVSAVVVTATDHRDRQASYAASIGSAKWGIAAPGGNTSKRVGEDIRSAYPDNRCGIAAGTSMAAPLVSGALAVLRSRGLSPQQAVQRILDTARDLGNEQAFGAGLLDMAAAVGGTSGGGSSGGGESPQPTSAPPATAGGSSGTPSATTPATAPSTGGGGGTATAVPSGGAPTTSGTDSPTDESADGTVDLAGTEDAEALADGSDDGALETVGGDEVAAAPGGDDGDGGPDGFLIAGAAIACLAGWVLAGRAALALRR